MRPIDVVLVGGGSDGKTFIIEKLVYNQAPPLSERSYFGYFLGSHQTTVNHEGIDLRLIFHDTQGQPEYDTLSRSPCPEISVYMVCFDINRVQDNVGRTEFWIEELNEYAPGIPIILLGCKKDSANVISLERARELGTRKVNELVVKNYIECSAHTGEGIVDILEAVIDASASSPPAPKTTSFSSKLRDSVKKLKLGRGGFVGQ